MKTIYYGGHVFTGALPLEQAFSVEEGMFRCVGSNELVLDTDTLATGQIRAYRLIWVGIRLILDKEFRTLLRQIRGKDKNKTSHRGPGGLRKKAASQLAKSGVEEAA